MIELVAFALLQAATSVGAIVAIRKSPVVREWDEKGVKPWACDLCMSFWTTLLVSHASLLLPDVPSGGFLLWMASFALAFTWLQRIVPAPPEGGGFPDDFPGEPPTTSPTPPG